MDEEGSPMGPYLRFVNAIADAVRESRSYDSWADEVKNALAAKHG